MATTKEATPNSNAAVRDLDWMLVMGSLLCAKSAPTTSAPFSAPRLCASTRKVSHNEKLESDAFQAARDYHPHSRRIMGDRLGFWQPLVRPTPRQGQLPRC